MSSVMNGQQLGGTVPIQLGQGQQQGAYGVQVPLAGVFPPQQQQQPAQPTGQQVINGNAGYSYGLDQLPPPPQQLQQPPYMGAQGGYGLQQQWSAAPQAPPQPGYAQQPQQGQPQYAPPPFPQAQFPQQQAPQTLQVGLNTRLDGPQIPQQLRGRTLGEAIQLYSALETNWAQRQTPAQQSLQQMQPQQQQQPVGPQAQVQSGQPQRQAASPWTQPEAFFGNLLDQKLQERLGPVIQHTQQQAVTQAYTIAKNGIADFGAIEADVMSMLANADPQTLSNPATWIGAADIVRGRQVREGRYQPQQQEQQMQIPGQQPQMQQYGQQTNPAMIRSQPAGNGLPTYGFFTEGPTAPNVSQFGNGGAQPSQTDYAMAQKFSMPIQEYMAWKTGVSPQQGQQNLNYNQQYQLMGAVPMGGVR